MSGIYSLPSTVFGVGDIQSGRQVRHKTYRLADKRDKEVIVAQNDACSNSEVARYDGDT